MADFTTLPDTTIEEEPQFKTLISKFENGFEQRRGKWANPIRKWKLVFTNRTVSEFQTVRDFFILKLGSLTSFTWVNPNDSVTYAVRFEEDSLNFQRKAYNIYDFELTIIQVL